jgi:hypothetical protein
MRRLVPLLAIAAIASVLYATSAPGARQAGSPRVNQVAALQKQMRVLQKQIRGLQERTTHLRSQVIWTLEMIEAVIADGDSCLAALAADEFQNTWSQIDRLATRLGTPPIFGAQTAIDDKKACQGLSVLRAPFNPSIAPTVAPFEAFIRWLNGG